MPRRDRCVPSIRRSVFSAAVITGRVVFTLCLNVDDKSSLSGTIMEFPP